MPGFTVDVAEGDVKVRNVVVKYDTPDVKILMIRLKTVACDIPAWTSGENIVLRAHPVPGVLTSKLTRITWVFDRGDGPWEQSVAQFMDEIHVALWRDIPWKHGVTVWEG